MIQRQKMELFSVRIRDCLKKKAALKQGRQCAVPPFFPMLFMEHSQLTGCIRKEVLQDGFFSVLFLFHLFF